MRGKWCGFVLASIPTILLTVASASAVTPLPGDAFIADHAGVVWLIDGVSGDREVVSSPGVALFPGMCGGAGSLYDCCTGPGSGDGTGACAAVGSGQWLQPLIGTTSISVAADGRVLLTGVFNQRVIVLRINPADGSRSILSCEDLTSICGAAGFPFPCCTGSGTGDGTPPCVAVGVGDIARNSSTLAPPIAAVPETASVAVAVLPSWGLPVLAGLLWGLSVRKLRRGVRSGSQG